MAREAHAERAQRKRSVEEKQPSSFPSLPGPKQAVFLAKSRIGGFLLRYLTIKIHFNS
ncbi:OLC1v1027906C1 [Oldenlandia corymbosa var. corymbosa]|uniref:OLC1v1027906C1 n=1 Tax=Oldenlandia corymbosa var. corymbosa TaxID=529605 RepID=A0AAV1CAI1_OLDCO|nr:OLC1v1027906C1 [Oldenlandia corymbosa var. corymbosa]